MFAGVAIPAQVVMPDMAKWGATSIVEVVPRARRAQPGARGPSYPLAHKSSMLEQLVDKEQRNGLTAQEAQPVVTRLVVEVPGRPAPAGWDLVM